jgi:hypothetical protein
MFGAEFDKFNEIIGRKATIVSDWKENALRWRDLYVQLRERTGEGDTAEVVRVESQTRRLAGS